jgi:WD40 repeat protein
MRVFNAFSGAVHALAVSPDGRFLAAVSAVGEIAVWDWATGVERDRVRRQYPAIQLAFAPDSAWWATVVDGPVEIIGLDRHLLVRLPPSSYRAFAGGIAFTPDGKHLVASETATWDSEPGLVRWTVPGWKPATGFDEWPPFARLAFSPDGQYLAGINPTRFELRIAVTGGLNGWGQPPPPEWGQRIKARSHLFLSFAHDSQTLVAGWDDEFHVLETVNGTPRRKVRAQDAPFRDAAFTGSGRHLGTVDGTGTLKLWDAEGWQVVRAYDWQVGPLTRVAFTADGLAGICGTGAGQLVVFDLDE